MLDRAGLYGVRNEIPGHASGTHVSERAQSICLVKEVVGDDLHILGIYARILDLELKRGSHGSSKWI